MKNGEGRMYRKTQSATIIGVEAKQVKVEADVTGGLPVFEMVGFLSSEIKEAKERVRAAIKNSGYELPPRRITVNLSPADLKKTGSGFDAPIAVSILSCLGYIKTDLLDKSLIVGELGLDGRMCHVNGILPIVAMAKEQGYEYCFLPDENRNEGNVVTGIKVVGVETLSQLTDLLNGKDPIVAKHTEIEELLEKQYCTNRYDMSDIYGQDLIKRGVKVAVAGMHNILLAGPPGSGKTMLAKRIPTILPKLNKEEVLEISKIYSVAGLLSENGIMLQRPYREAHHTITIPALVGGGVTPKPGEVTLAHKGVLFLDEYTEYNRKVMEVLRQPIEDREVILSRVRNRYHFPAEFMMVCATNLCPCGYFPDRKKCNCTEYAIQKYLGKVSGPIIDRIDIGLFVSRMKLEEIENKKKGESSKEMRIQVERARKMQQERYRNTNIDFNAGLSATDIKKYCTMTKSAKELLELAYKKMDLSMRGYHKIRKVARTIADLDGIEKIQEEHMAEAIGYRIGDLRELAVMHE